LNKFDSTYSISGIIVQLLRTVRSEADTKIRGEILRKMTADWRWTGGGQTQTGGRQTQTGGGQTQTGGN
jgi:hypothetical protein